jgi:type II secretory pathway component HofQ
VGLDAAVAGAPTATALRIAVARRGVGLDVDLYRVDVRPALEALGRAAGRNLILLGEVSGQVTLQLRDVPPLLAIRAAAAAAGCVAEDQGELIVVRRPSR